MTLSCGLNPVRDFTSSTPTCALDAVFKGWAKDYMMHWLNRVCLEDTVKQFQLKLVEGLRGQSGVTGSFQYSLVGDS